MSETKNAKTKMILKLYVPGAARRFIATRYPGCPVTTRYALARREVVLKYLQEKLDRLSELLPYWESGSETLVESEETATAIEYLRARGWDDKRIHAWILLQRARSNHLFSLVPPTPTPKDPI